MQFLNSFLKEIICNMDRNEFIKELKCKIEDADVLLIGLGEEFECRKELLQNVRYAQIYDEIREKNFEWIFPYLNFYFIRKEKTNVLEGLKNLAELIKNKNYFLISTCCNDLTLYAGFQQERIVSPCGGFQKMQPFSGDVKTIVEVDQSVLDKINEYFEGKISLNSLKNAIFCGENPMVFNSIVLENYNEDGYLQDWENYTKWIQTTLNKKLCVIELGVGMNYPSVIRWPFEKVAFFNNKASIFRVHKSLYQISKELHDKGRSLDENACSFVCVLS